MGLSINRKANPPGAAGQESTTFGSAYHEYRFLVGDDTCPAMTIDVIEFADKQHDLDNKSVKQLFDHIWKKIESDRRSNVVLDLAEVSNVDPLFKQELTYLGRQLRQQRRIVRLSGVSLKGDWERWL